MILPSGLSTTNYSISAASKGWGAGWPNCSAINGGAMVKVTYDVHGTANVAIRIEILPKK